MAEQRIIFEYPADSHLAEELYTQVREDQNVVLFEAHSPASNIDSIRVQADVKSGFVNGREVQQLHLSSGIAVTDFAGLPTHTTRRIAKEMRHSFNKLGEQMQISTPGGGLVVVNDGEKNSPFLGLSALALQGGRKWAISSANWLAQSRAEAETDLPAIHYHIHQHALALGAVATNLASQGFALFDNERRFAFMSLHTPGDSAHLPVLAPKLEIRSPESLRPTEPTEDPFKDFVGIDHVVDELRDMVRLANVPQLILEQHQLERNQTVLLYGPSGVGKTALMRALGTALEARIDEIDYEEASGMYVTEAANKIKTRFAKAYDSDERVLIVLDELDSILGVGNSHVDGTIIGMLKRELEEIKRHPRVFFAAATNYIDNLDRTLIVDKRFPLKLQIASPTESQRASIFQHYVLGKSGEKLTTPEELIEHMERLDQFDFAALAAQTEDFSGGDIREIVMGIKKRKILEAYEKDEPAALTVTQAELVKAIDKARKARPQAT